MIDRRQQWPKAQGWFGIKAAAVVLGVVVAGGLARAEEGQDPDEPDLTIVPAPKPRGTALERPPTDEQRAVLLRRVANVRKALRALVRKDRSLSKVVRTSVEGEAQRLEQLLNRRPATCNPASEVKRLERDLALVAAGEPPYGRAGLHRLYYRSALDRRLHGFMVYVPPAYAQARQTFPLVVMLHGMRSSPMRGMARLFGVVDDELDQAQLTCSRPKLPPHATLVVAPSGFGDAFYRTAGERDVSTVVALTRRIFRVDPRRITISGLSMGGTGAVEVALQHPDLYAGVLALCGYYDRQLDRQVRGQPVQSWERHMLSVHSPVRWALNGAGIPLVLVHGTLDGPQRARSMERTYRKLGYPVAVELHRAGHDVWTPGYAAGRAFQLLKKFRKARAPARVSFTSGRSRVRRAHWVVVEAWQDYARWVRVDARIAGRDRVEVKTDNVARLRLDLPLSRIARATATTLTIDGTTLQVPPQRSRWTRRVHLLRSPQGWIQAPAGPRWETSVVQKRPGLAGPMEDIYFDPILVVYGTGGGQGPRLKRLAKRLAGVSRHVDLSYPVISDRAYRPRLAQGRSVILVGNERTNRVLARIAPHLPIRVTDKEIHLGTRRIERPNVGATFIYPNPDSPRWYVMVVAGTTPDAYKRYRLLPRYLPDYVVFDDEIEVRRWRSLLGKGRSVVEAGFFDNQWRLPGR